MKRVAVPLAALGLLMSQALPSQAITAPITFAQFTDGTPGTHLTNSIPGGTWASSTLGTTGAYAIKFFFNDESGIPAELQPTPFNSNITATLVYSATTLPLGGSNLPYAVPGAGNSATQPFTSVSLSVVAVGTQLVGGITIPNGANLLTMTSGLGPDPNNIGGTLGGTQGGSSATFQGATTTSGSTNKVTFTSAYLDFTAATQEAYALSYTGIPSFTLAGPIFQQYISAFTAETTGTFDATLPVTPTTPEPGAMSLIVGMGIGATSLVMRRRRA